MCVCASLRSSAGYHLGEFGSWRKGTVRELATRVPLIIRAPWKPATLGARSSDLVELIDLYKTVAALAGAPPPEEGVAGVDLSPLFDDGASSLSTSAPRTAARPLKRAAFSQIPRCRVNATWSHYCSKESWNANTCARVESNACTSN